MVVDAEGSATGSASQPAVSPDIASQLAATPGSASPPAASPDTASQLAALLGLPRACCLAAGDEPLLKDIVQRGAEAYHKVAVASAPDSVRQEPQPEEEAEEEEPDFGTAEDKGNLHIDMLRL